MRWLEIFKLYNLKLLKKDKLILIFTALSILITVSISLIIPQVDLENKKYMHDKVRELNGGDLKVIVEYPSVKFQEKLVELKDRGLKLKTFSNELAFFPKGDNKFVSRLIRGKFDLNNDEIILYSNIAKKLKVKVNDTVVIKANGIDNRNFKIKAIEPMGRGVDSESELLGYGKIEGEEPKAPTIILISGENGEKLKEELKSIEIGYKYSSLEDKKKSLESQLSTQITVLNVLNTMGYILSILTIVSSTIMLILKRKKDIAILKMISINSKSIKLAIRMELSFLVIVPHIIAGLISYPLSKVILNKAANISSTVLSKDNIMLILKGLGINGVLFLTFLSLALILLDSIKPLSLVKEDEKAMKKVSKKIVLGTIILIPVILVIYSVYYIEKISTLGGSIGILLFITVFLGIISIILRVLSKIPFRNSIILYSFKSIRKNFFSFVLVLLSITLSLWFVLIGFGLENTIKTSFNKDLESKLPYNYILGGEDDEKIYKSLGESDEVQGFSKIYTRRGKVLNEEIDSKGVTIGEVKAEDYGTKFEILEGEDLFQGDSEGIIISRAYKEKCNLSVGKNLQIETKEGVFSYKIKGIYECSTINSSYLLTEYRGAYESQIIFYVKANTDDFQNSLKDCFIVSIGELGDSLSAMLNKFLGIFKVLCFITMFSAILFNINMVYMNYQGEEKDETVIRALGIGKSFLLKYQSFKICIVIVTSIFMSLGLYFLMIDFFFKLAFKGSVQFSGVDVLISIIISVILSLISFNFPIRKLLRKHEFELLREQV